MSQFSFPPPLFIPAFSFLLALPPWYSLVSVLHSSLHLRRLGEFNAQHSKNTTILKIQDPAAHNFFLDKKQTSKQKTKMEPMGQKWQIESH